MIETIETMPTTKPGAWVRVPMTDGRYFSGKVAGTDTNGLYLSHVNTDAQDAECGDIVAVPTFLPWANVAAVIRWPGDEDHDEIEDMSPDQGFTALLESVTADRSAMVTTGEVVEVITTDGDTFTGTIDRQDAQGLLLLLRTWQGKDQEGRRYTDWEHLYFPWPSVRMVKWSERKYRRGEG